MDRLRALFAEFGCAEVATHIASGNVLFGGEDTAAPEWEARIEAGLERALGYGVATFLRTPEELASILEAAPLRDAPEGATVYVGLTRSPLGRDERDRVLALGSAEDGVAVEGSQIYWTPAGRSSDSKLSGATFERALGRAVTFRNDRTVRGVAEKLAP